MEECNKMCLLSFEDHSLRDKGSNSVLIHELEDVDFETIQREILTNTQNSNLNEPKMWTNKINPLPLRNGAEMLTNLLSKRFLENNKFYFIYSEGKLKSESDSRRVDKEALLNSAEDVYTSVKKETEDVSIFGSPLKMQSIADLSLNLNDTSISDCLTTNSPDQCLSHLLGLPIREAREILSKFCQLKKIQDGKSFYKTLVILCNGTDHNKTLLLGAHHEFGEESRNRKLVTFRVTCNSKKHNLSFLEPLSLTDAQECQMKSTFELLLHRNIKRHLRIDAYWSDKHGKSSISLHTARFFLHLKAPFGFKESPLYKHYSQLRHILMLSEGLKDGELPNVLSSKPFDAQENLQNLILQIKNGVEDSASPICGSGKKIDLKPSYTLDVTDQLWGIFSQCQNYQDMVTCLKTIFQVLKKNEILFFVRADNETMLARLIRQAAGGLNYFPSLSNLMPLRIIAELGLERMKKVYTNILHKNNLCSLNDINDFLKDSLRDNDNDSLSSSTMQQDHHVKDALVDTVVALHHCLDLVCLVDLHTDHLDLKTVASYVLNQYRVNGWDEDCELTIPLNTRQATLEVEKLSPSMVKREYTVGQKSHVDCYLSEMPEALGLVDMDVTSTVQNDCNNSSTLKCNESNIVNSKECFKLENEENVYILGL